MNAAAGIENTGAVFPTKRLKHVVALRRLRTPTGNAARPYVGLEDIESGTGRLVNGPGRVAGSSPSAPSMTDGGGERDRFFHQNAGGNSGSAPSVTDGKEAMGTDFEPGDVLFGKLRPYLAKAWVAEFPGRCTTEALVMEPTSIEPRFLRSVCLSFRFVSDVDASTFGSKMPRAEWAFIGNMPVPVPDPDTQTAIADYLDRETARLDALVAAKEHLLKLLAEKRRAIVTRAVTRGLPPEAARAADLDPHPKIKSSGLDWIGDVPDHWAVVPLVRITETIQTGPFGSQLHAADYVEGGVPLVNPAHMVAGRLVPDENSTVDEITAERLKRHELRVGDIVMARRGEIGRCGAVGPDEAGWLCGTGSLLIRLRDCDASYFSMLFACAGFSQLLALHAVGTTMANLNPMIVGRMLVPVPPFTEQRAIAAYLNRTMARLDALMDRVRKAMRLAKERRAALIAAAVTGRLDVGRMPCG